MFESWAAAETLVTYSGGYLGISICLAVADYRCVKIILEFRFYESRVIGEWLALWIKSIFYVLIISVWNEYRLNSQPPILVRKTYEM